MSKLCVAFTEGQANNQKMLFLCAFKKEVFCVFALFRCLAKRSAHPTLYTLKMTTLQNLGEKKHLDYKAYQGNPVLLITSNYSKIV